VSKKKLPVTILDIGGTFKVGDMPPSGYCDWHQWAEVQHKGGLRQKRCGFCSKWNFPQEMGVKFCKTCEAHQEALKNGTAR